MYITFVCAILQKEEDTEALKTGEREEKVTSKKLSSAGSSDLIKGQTWSDFAEIWTACLGLTVLHSERLDRWFELLIESYGSLITAGQILNFW